MPDGENRSPIAVTESLTVEPKLRAGLAHGRERIQPLARHLGPDAEEAAVAVGRQRGRRGRPAVS